MRKLLVHSALKLLASIAFAFFLISCSALDEVIHPDEKPTTPTWPPYEQVLRESYKGPKARAAVIKFTDKSRETEMSQVGDGMAEMLRIALADTNRYIVQVRKSSDDVITSQDIRGGIRFKKEEEIDLLIEGVIREFEPGIPGAGEDAGGASYATVIVTVTDPMTNQMLASEKIRGKAKDFRATSRRRTPLPEVFKDFSRTPMEKAIRATIEELASFIVAKTPSKYYRLLPAPPPKSVPKAASVPTKVISSPPRPPPPPLPTTEVIWEFVNLRKGPGTRFKVVGNVKKGTSLKILEISGDWLHVRLDDGSSAWVSKLATSEAPRRSSSSSSPPPPPPDPSPPPPTTSVMPMPM